MFFLYLLDDVIVFVLLLLLYDLFEPCLTHTETWLPYDEIRVLLLLFDDSCCDVACDDVVTAHWRCVLLVFYEFSLEF